MPTLGEELRRRREERGTTLAEISEATRIGTRFLKAIETDNFSVLPGGIYTRNFIRSYAERVGMSEDEAIALYQQQVSGVSGDLPQLAPELHFQPASESRVARPDTMRYKPNEPRTSWSTLVIAAGVVLIIVIIALSIVQRLNRPSPESEPPSSTSASPQVTPPPPQTATPAQKTEPQAPKTEPPPSTAPAASPLPAGEPLRVKLEATTGPSSISYWVDDETKSSNLFLNQGEAGNLPPAQNEVRLSIGNRMTLKLIINDREATFPPETQKFRARVTISRENLQTFFPN